MQTSCELSACVWVFPLIADCFVNKVLFVCLSEKHYLTELQQLGLLSYTPSREVQGKRISSYDDRYKTLTYCFVYTTHHISCGFVAVHTPVYLDTVQISQKLIPMSLCLCRMILQHAQKTGGVIVTNDNLRDLLDESPVWRDIIKKR